MQLCHCSRACPLARALCFQESFFSLLGKRARESGIERNLLGKGSPPQDVHLNHNANAKGTVPSKASCLNLLPEMRVVQLVVGECNHRITHATSQSRIVLSQYCCVSPDYEAAHTLPQALRMLATPTTSNVGSGGSRASVSPVGRRLVRQRDNARSSVSFYVPADTASLCRFCLPP
ncbi:hypothetical protein BCV70DRAFT_50734 [Testicularia cyperi]|uniref:Uncharacterized protein n=1 Tax=Testicularia cyperi TaxID=1882483 RepID=A0A317XGU6_9BASI|nr:hypothetical protein BCV70DRAFT_50734 [Testicularia cyperi]